MASKKRTSGKATPGAASLFASAAGLPSSPTGSPPATTSTPISATTAPSSEWGTVPAFREPIQERYYNLAQSEDRSNFVAFGKPYWKDADAHFAKELEQKRKRFPHASEDDLRLLTLYALTADTNIIVQDTSGGGKLKSLLEKLEYGETKYRK